MHILKQGIVIAIDGPAGTGKSSVTRLLAERLGFIHIDTGALYRAIAYLAHGQNDGNNVLEPKASQLAKTAHLEFKLNPKLVPVNRIFANGSDVTDFIRTPLISMLASQVSSYSQVRAALLGLQRRLGCQGNSILEGRDIGTVIFPDADLKFFLTASSFERARRRFLELKENGGDAPPLSELKKQIQKRDLQDSSRAVAPLKKAQDALTVNTTKMTLDEVVSTLENRIKKYFSKSTCK
ncbi:MAG: (d)CMP kinase [Bdellovibrio sp.]|nr:(d)CMP kinase [Bdellovibrio sp.]